eukprot:SAG31_NODE_11335_length_1041_cov_1.441614_1_plen_179_part_10
MPSVGVQFLVDVGPIPEPGGGGEPGGGTNTARSCSVEVMPAVEDPTRRRLSHLAATIVHSEPDTDAALRLEFSSAEEAAPNPELIPFGFQDSLLRGRWAYEHLRWMRQKDQLGQDIFLVGMYGPLRRLLAMVFCEKAGREMEYLALTQDTTESDLKQRREILAGGSAMYFDQSAVNAAL